MTALDEAKLITPSIAIGDFVTADLIEGNSPRQGVVIRTNPNGTLTLRGESGAVYLCKSDAAIISNNNIWGDTAEFVRKTREQLINNKYPGWRFTIKPSRELIIAECERDSGFFASCLTLKELAAAIDHSILSQHLG